MFVFNIVIGKNSNSVTYMNPMTDGIIFSYVSYTCPKALINNVWVETAFSTSSKEPRSVTLVIKILVYPAALAYSQSSYGNLTVMKVYVSDIANSPS